MFIVKRVRFKNFRSWGNQFTEIDLVKSNTTVITAKNGHGKTSMLHAITFGLFGKVPGISKPTLVNEINGKDCLVEVECEKNGQQIFIRRGIKPNIFEIYLDGKAVDQSSSSLDYQAWLEDSVLGFNLNSFQQVISISGSSYTPFFKLPAGQRRKMVEDLLMITVFSKMYAIHVGNSNALKDSIYNIEKDIEKYTESIASLKKGLAEIENKDSDVRQVTQERIDANLLKVQETQREIDVLEDSITAIDFSAIEHTKAINKLKKLGDISSTFDKNKKTNEKFIDFLKTNSVCPTCSHDLDDEFKDKHICLKTEKNADIDAKKVELQSVLEDTKTQIEKFKSQVEQITDIREKINHLKNIIALTENTISVDRLNLKAIKNSSESTLKADIIEKDSLLKKCKEDKKKLLIEKQYLDLQSAILKDSGIKSRIVKQFVPKMIKDLNHYLNVMELGSSIEIDDNFNETIYRRFKDPVNYETLSAGERTRVDLSTLFTWRELAKARNSLNCNLLFIDEAFDNTLDSEGLELFISLLKNNMKDTNVFLISHIPSVVDKFESNIRIEKRGNFSQIV